MALMFTKRTAAELQAYHDAANRFLATFGRGKRPTQAERAAAIAAIEAKLKL